MPDIAMRGLVHRREDEEHEIHIGEKREPQRRVTRPSGPCRYGDHREAEGGPGDRRPVDAGLHMTACDFSRRGGFPGFGVHRLPENGWVLDNPPSTAIACPLT